MPDKYEDGKTAMGTQYPSHLLRKKIFVYHRKRKKNLIFVWRDQSLTIFSNINAL